MSRNGKVAGVPKVDQLVIAEPGKRLVPEAAAKQIRAVYAAEEQARAIRETVTRAVLTGMGYDVEDGAQYDVRDVEGGGMYVDRKAVAPLVLPGVKVGN